MNYFIDSPCHNCTKRTVMCHKDCEEYIEYQKIRKKATINERKARSSYSSLGLGRKGQL